MTSDDFNACAVDGSVWTFVDPVGDSSVSVNGTQLELSVPAGTAHDVWSGGNMAPRLMQPVGDSDFEVEVKFESSVTDSFEMQGLIVQQDLDDFLRFDFYGDGGQTRVFAARVVGGSPTALTNVAIPVSAAPLYLKVTRTGDTWALAYSGDGSTWTSVTSFVHALAVSEVGPFVGNAGSSPPAHTALIDYVFDTNSPIVPEDPDTPPCTDASADPVVDTPPVVSTGIVAFEVDRLVTVTDRGFPWRAPPMAYANGDWTSPIDYAGGSLHFRAEIKGGGQPSAEAYAAPVLCLAGQPDQGDAVGR